MANIKVSEMTEATSFDDGDYTMIVQANQNKKISKENMFGGIEENIGDLSNLETQNKTSIVNAINSTNLMNIFSTTEQLIGKWIDGNNLYRIVLTSTGTFSNANYNIGALDDNYKMRFCFGTFYNSSNNNEYVLSNPTTEIRHIGGNINVKFDVSWGDGTTVLIVYYTK